MTATMPVTRKAAMVLVAVDGSPGSDAALAWALEEARVRGCEVEAMVARSVRVAGREHVSYDALTPARCEHLLAESLERVGGCGGVRLRLETRDDDLMFELGLEASARGAGLIVLGAPSHGHLVRVTSPRALRRLCCPVVVVPSRFVRQPIRRVLVDLECGGESLGALRWAVGEAVLTGAALEVAGLGTRGGEFERRVGEILGGCAAAGIDATPGGLHRQGADIAVPDLVVRDLPARHWWHGGHAEVASPSRSCSPSQSGVPLVLVAAGVEWRDREAP